jgi:hypothetical protein
MTAITENGWWEDYSDLPTGFRMYVELEAAASGISTWDAELIHGLLQTPAYHRAVFEAEEWPTPDAGERQVRLRAERQRAAFDWTPPLQVSAVIGEGALARQVGGKTVMAEQNEHLLKLSRRPNVDLHVLGWTAGAHAAMKGAFTVLGFDKPDDPDVVYLETVADGRYMEQSDLLARYRRNFERVRSRSVPLEGVPEMSTNVTQWIKASASGGSGQCVEMRRHDQAVEVRDTKAHGQGPTLRIAPSAFASWIDAAKNGELDHLITL